MNYLEEKVALKVVAICGLQTPLGKALHMVLGRNDCEVLEITEAMFHLPAPSLAEKLSGVDGIVNLYGEPYIAKWSGRYEFDIYKSRLEALRFIGVALRYMSPKPKFFVTLSNAMVYDQFEVHDEYSSVYGDGFMAEVGQMETVEARKIANQRLETRLILARAGYMLSRNGGAYPLLASLAKIGWGGRVDDGYQCLPMIHIDDAVNAILNLALDDRAEGIYNLTIPDMASMNELVKAFATSLSRSQHRLPKFIIKLMTGRAINLLEQNCKVIPKRLNELGFEFKYPSVDAIIADLRKKK